MALLFFGCNTTGTIKGAGTSGIQQFQLVEDGGLLTVFLNLKQSAGPEISLSVSAVEIHLGNKWIQLNNAPLKLNSKKIGSGQVFIARKGLPRGNYDSLRFMLEKASMKKGGSMQPLSLEETTVVMDLPSSVSLQRNSSQSLFVTWDVLASLARQNTMKADMTAALQAIPLVVDLAFIACPDLDTVYVVRTDRNWVISSISIPGRPTYLDVDSELNRLYVLAAEENSIMVYDLNTNKLTDKIFVPMDNQPSFMLVGPNKQYAYLLDKLGKSIARVDVLSGLVEERVTFFFHPNYAIFLQDQGNLAVSASDTNSVYRLYPDNLQTVDTIAVGSNPQGLLSELGSLFVAESGANTTTSYNLADGSQRNRVNVGFSQTRLLMKNNQLYVSNFMSGSITVTIPGQLTILNDIIVGGQPEELATTDSRPWIYAGNAVSGGLTVINSSSNRVAGFIDLAAYTLGIAVLD
jgi:DNA-binding beta-propeller fold protein YncE